MMELEKQLKKIWYDENQSALNPIPLLLHGLSLPYSAVIRLRNHLYDKGIVRINKVACPVISVGNLTAGGTGKTPAVILVARMLQEAGYRPAVLSRGYGGRSKLPVSVVSDGKEIHGSVEETGDEPYLIARSLPGVPVITGPQRYRTARHALTAFGCNVILLDDGFQHRSLHRDLDIVLMDSMKPLGNGHILPRGPLREPLSSLKRANLLILTRSDDDTILASQTFLGKAFPDLPICRSRHRPTAVLSGKGSDVHPPEFLSGKKVLAFTGIAQPESFAKTLEELGAMLIRLVYYPDHYLYGEEDIGYLLEIARQLSVDAIVTTEKDGVKLSRFSDFYETIYQLSIEMEITTHKEIFEDWILKRLHS